MTHDELCEIAVKFLRKNGFEIVFDDKLKSVNSSGEQPDVIGFRSSVSCLIEAKVSRSDFLTDKKKRFRINPELGMGDWRFFISPPDIISIDDLPKGWGLLHVVGKTVKKVHKWPSNCLWISEKPFKSDKQAECNHLYSALRRMNK
ncbi:hypothetical protein AB6G31_03840 [Providencia hangzhouensis]|uniref:hypothetical protein n=1 Tax=Providencia TaxID=586 RepID=UPI002349662E|nr:hypothetical protein [Providencia sp. PROV021]